MKLTLSKQLLFFVILLLRVKGEDHEECTHGTLFISAANSTTVKSYKLDGSLTGLSSNSILALPGGYPLVLEAFHSGLNLVASFWGTSTSFLADGRVSFIHAGVEKEDHGDHFHIHMEPPSVYVDHYPVGPVYHGSSDNTKIVLFSDGSYTADPQRNSTIAVFDESRLGSIGAWLANYTLQGSHHGVAVPIGNDHVLHSLATQNRIDRVTGASSLADTFQVVDYEGNVLHSIADVSDQHKHCRGFHGSANLGNTVILACGENGLLAVHFNESSGTYSSNAIQYPLVHAIVGYRTSGFQYHLKRSVVVGNFNHPNATFDYYLVAVPTTSTKIMEKDMLNLGTTWSGSCQRGFELAEGKLFLIMMPNGFIQIYTIDDGWELVAEKQVIPGATSCTGLMMVPGYHQAFVIDGNTKTLYALSLDQAAEGIVGDAAVSTLDFTPHSAAVAGVPEGTECPPETPPPLCIPFGMECNIGAVPCCGANRVCMRAVRNGRLSCRNCKKVSKPCTANRDCCSKKCLRRRGGRFCAM